MGYLDNAIDKGGWCDDYKKEIERLESLINLKSFQIETLEHNIDLLDSNYQKVLYELTTDDIDRLNLVKLPESLKPQIVNPEFKIIAADEGQDLSHTEIKLSEL